MGVSKRALLLVAAASAFFRARAVQSDKYIAGTAAIFSILLLSKWFWGKLVYPLFLSPLRVLPQPEVSWFQECRGGIVRCCLN